jgi:hypothetical protein
MDTDKIKIYGARVRVDSMTKVRPGQGGGRCRLSRASCCWDCSAQRSAAALYASHQGSGICILMWRAAASGLLARPA